MDLPFRNNSDHEIQLGLEPEGDSIPLGPGDRCIVRLTEADDLVSLELDFEYCGDLFSITAMSSKVVFLNGEQIR